MVEEFIAAFHAEINRQRLKDQDEKKRMERDHARVKVRLNGLIDAIADGLRTPGTLAKLTELKDRKARLEAEMGSMPGDMPLLLPNLSQLYRSKVAKLHETLKAPEHKHEALEILRGLIDCVRVSAPRRESRSNSSDTSHTW